mgnify:CR=1 FL=1
MNNILSKIVLCLVIVFASANSYSLPISWNLEVNGSERVITTDTGMRWLSPFSSNSLSWDAIVNAQNAGPSIYDGYRRADTNEFLDLISAYGMTATPSWFWSALDIGELDLINEFQQDFGLTYDGGINHAYTYGALINASTGMQTLAIVGKYQNQELVTSYYSNWGDNSTRNSIVGQWLIADSVQVPEPSTLAIFALGMIGLASRRFKKQS